MPEIKLALCIDGYPTQCYYKYVADHTASIKPQPPNYIMFKSAIALAACLACFSGAAEAATIGIRNEAGASHRTITHGRTWSSYEGKTETDTKEVTRSRVRNGNMNSAARFGQGTANNANADSGQDASRTRSRRVTETEGWETYKGGSSNSFSGVDHSVFSESSIFTR